MVFEIYSLAAGFYPLVGDINQLNVQTEDRDYGLGSSMLSVENYKRAQYNHLVTTNLGGNVIAYGMLQDVGHVGKTTEDEILAGMAQLPTDDLLSDVAKDVDSAFAESLTKEEIIPQHEKGITGRSMEELGVHPTIAGMESQMRGSHMLEGSTAIPPDLLAANKGVEVTRQRLGERGHAFTGSVLKELRDEIKTIDLDKDRSEESRHYAKMQAGLTAMKTRFSSYNTSIRKLREHFKIKSRLEFVTTLKDIKYSPDNASGDDARRLGSDTVKKGATGYLTNHALDLIKHTMSFNLPIEDTYVIEPEVFAHYLPIVQRPANHPDDPYTYRVDEIRGFITYGLLAGDTYLRQQIAGFNSEEASSSRFGALVSKTSTGHGTIMETGTVYKQQVAQVKKNLKLVPTVSVTKASQDFNDVIGKKLYPNLARIADKELEKNSHVLTQAISKYGVQSQIHESENIWGQPYVTSMSFRKQAYGTTSL